MPRIKPVHGEPPRPARRGRFWPILIVGLLSAHVVGMVSTAVLVSRNRGEMAVIPDYYRKAQAWDAYKQQLTASDKLNWNVEIQPVAALDPLGRQQLRIALTDSGGAPINPTVMQIHCFHLSHGDEAATYVPPADPTGGRLIPIPAHREGFWQFDITAQSGSKVYIKTITQYVDGD